MIWYPARVLPPVGIVAGLVFACAHGRGAGESAAVQRPAPPPPSPSTVTSDEIARQPVVSLDQLLAGRIAGVTVTPARGGGISVRISGTTSSGAFGLPSPNTSRMSGPNPIAATISGMTMKKLNTPM